MTSKSGLDYAAAGVDYGTLDASKVLAQKAARATAVNLALHDATEIAASRGESAYLVEVGGLLIASITECLGTKVLVADDVRDFSGRTHYDTIAQDTIAMAVNDLVTVGATPLSTHAYWSAGSSAWFADKERMQDLVRGWQAACDVCGMAWGGGETPALGGVVEAQRIDLAASCVGIVKGRDRLMLGERLQAGDAIVLLSSSGIHANGISVARKLVELLPEGYRTPLADGRSFGEALLDPTVLYPPVIEALFKAGIRPHYAVNITGHGWRKLMRHPAELKYRIRRVPPVPHVLAFLQTQGGMSARDAYGTFNMGAGFALFMARSDVAAAIATAERAGLGAWHAGAVEAGTKSLLIEPLELEYTASELRVRD
jgi:phosphoribosylformylglycinamidine cyclo-ligase